MMMISKRLNREQVRINETTEEHAVLDMAMESVGGADYKDVIATQIVAGYPIGSGTLFLKVI